MAAVRWRYEDEDDDADKFEKFKEHRHKPPEFQKEKNPKRKPARRASHFEEEEEGED